MLSDTLSREEALRILNTVWHDQDKFTEDERPGIQSAVAMIADEMAKTFGEEFVLEWIFGE